MSEDPLGFVGGDANTARYVGNGVDKGMNAPGIYALALTLTAFSADVATPEPSDLAWPKWIGWGVAIGGAAAIDAAAYIWYSSDASDDEQGRGGHRNNQRESNRETHERGDARRGGDRRGE